METKRSSFTGKLGFVLAAAGSAVGLGNIWRFPYLAAQYGGGIFLLVYLILAVTFGFASSFIPFFGYIDWPFVIVMGLAFIFIYAKHIPNIKIKTNIANLPERVVVDVSKINIGETLSVKDLNLGKDVEILTDANLPIVSVSPAR